MRDHIQAVIKVLAEDSGLNRGFQIPISRGNQPDVHTDRARAANALEFPFLQNPQQLGLKAGGKLTHFIQKQRAAIRRLKFALSAVPPRR